MGQEFRIISANDTEYAADASIELLLRVARRELISLIDQF
jgi:hypothetical protein